MTISEERMLNIEELLSNIRSSKEITKKNIKTEENKAVNNLKHMSKSLPIGMIMLIILFAALGTMVIMLKTEVADFSGLREQIAASDSKFKIAIIEDKLEVSEKEREALKKELAQIKHTIETIRNINTDRKKLAGR